MKSLRWPIHSLSAITLEVLNFAAEHGTCVVTCRGLTITLRDDGDSFDHGDMIGTYNQDVNVAHLHSDILDAMKLGFDDVHRRG